MKTIDVLITELTLEEKAALLAGTNSMRTNAVSRLDIPQLMFADGPHGLRKITGDGVDGFAGSEPATAFPTSAAIASGWNEENARKAGEAIGNEALSSGVNVVLGPGVNIKRDPRCGRNFEYYSEDPFLAGKMGCAFVDGVQSRGIGVSVKHFAANNSENYRFMGDSIVDERALREIYLKAFERIVKEQKPYTIMCAYNRLNGIFCSGNRWLLTKVLRDEWGFDGLVMSDWGAVQDRVSAVAAGMDLEMPGDTDYFRKQIVDAVRAGELSEEELDTAVCNVLKLVTRCMMQKKKETANIDANHKLAADIAADCAVLLKNDGILPLEKNKKYLVAGEMFENMRYQGAGSSLVNPARLTSPKQAFDLRGISYTKDISEAASCDAILFFGGLTEEYEMEGGDRCDLSFPREQIDSLTALIKTGKPVAVVLYGGSPVELPFEQDVSAILNMYLPGQNGGDATAALLFGEKNPSGKLAETWPLRCEDIPFYNQYSKSEIELYRESVFVGYRYYDAAKKDVIYPFGYGLSYTTFEYSDISVIQSNESIIVSCNIKNAGIMPGAEVVQLYVSHKNSRVYKPEKELRGFIKIFLGAGETRRAEISFDIAELSYYNIIEKAWVIENGIYELLLGASSRDIRLSSEVEILGKPEINCPYSEDVMMAYTNLSKFEINDEVFSKFIGRNIPKITVKLPITLESRFTDLKQTFWGRILYRIVISVSDRQLRKAKKLPEGFERNNRIKNAQFMRLIFDSNSLRSLAVSSSGMFPYNFAQGFMEISNGHILRGVSLLCKKYKAPKLPR